LKADHRFLTAPYLAQTMEKTMPIEAVIFDMDGLLIDSEPVWQRVREDLAREVGKTWTPENQKHTMGVNTVEWAAYMQQSLALDMPVEAIIDDILARMAAYYRQEIPLMPGALESVHLAAKHFRVGLASGSATPLIQTVLRLTRLDDVFEVVVYGDDIPKGKPSPDIYLEAMRQLGISPMNAAGVEDSTNGIRALKAAGLHAIAVPNPGFPVPTDVLQTADRVLHSLNEISLELLRGLAGGS
jgi:HAD superfamily hydrolase (TIGR01509 family)